MKKISSLSIVILFKVGSLLCVAPTFELYNKSKENIWVRLKNGNDIVKYQRTEVFSSQPGRVVQLNPDTNKESHLEVWFDDPEASLYGRKRADYELDLPAKRNLYLTYAPSLNIYPQTGPWKGLLGKTKSGLSLKNNVLAAEIVVKYTSPEAWNRHNKALSSLKRGSRGDDDN